MPLPVLIEIARTQAIRRARLFQAPTLAKRAILTTALEEQRVRLRVTIAEETRRIQGFPVAAPAALVQSCCWPFSFWGITVVARNFSSEFVRNCFGHADFQTTSLENQPCPDLEERQRVLAEAIF